MVASFWVLEFSLDCGFAWVRRFVDQWSMVFHDIGALVVVDASLFGGGVRLCGGRLFLVVLKVFFLAGSLCLVVSTVYRCCDHGYSSANRVSGNLVRKY